jgi:cellulose biosynthesis protein BcsQ
MRTIALYSNKGGVGKTAGAVNLSYLSAKAGNKTLICDLDPQSSATFYFRIKPTLKSGAKGFVNGDRKVYKSIKGTDYENLDLLPADFSHRRLDIAFSHLKGAKNRLKKILKPLKDEYDVIILDCPSGISVLAENVLNTANCILTPLIPTTLSIRTYLQLLVFCKKNNIDSRRMYTFFSMVDRRKKMHKVLVEKVSKSLKNVLQGDIPYLSIIEQMGLYREPVGAFSPDSIASIAYQRLWESVQKSQFA